MNKEKEKKVVEVAEGVGLAIGVVFGLALKFFFYSLGIWVSLWVMDYFNLLTFLG